MLSLELSKVNATLENVNLRVEKAGQDKVPAADPKISVPESADVLAHFSPTLKAFLFDEEGPKDLAEGMRLRDPHLGYPLSRDEEMTGATVKIGFRVQCRPTPEQVAKLYQLQESGVEFTLEPMPLPAMKAA